MLFKKDEIKHLGVFYLNYLIMGLSMLIMPYMIIYFIDIGFSFTQIGIFTAAQGIAIFLFEVPTGALADAKSRKFSVVLGYFLFGLSVLLVPLTDSFLLMIIIWILIGASYTFISGAEEAWIIDNLNHVKRKDLHQEYFIKNTSISALGMVVSPLIAAALVGFYSMRILWFVLGIGLIINGLILLFFTDEHYKPKKLKLKKSIKETFKNSKKGINYTIKTPNIRILIIGGILGSMMLIGKEGMQPFLVNTLGMPLTLLGIMFSIMSAIGMVTPFLSRFIKTKIKPMIISLILITMFGFGSMYFTNSYIYVMVLFSILPVLGYVLEPKIQSYMHKHIPKKIRATVISVQSMANQLAGSLLVLIGGVLMDTYSPRIVIAGGAIFGIFAIINYLQLKEE